MSRVSAKVKDTWVKCTLGLLL